MAAAEAPLQLRLPLASRELQVPGGLAAGGDRKRRDRRLEAGSGLGGGSGAAAEGPGVWRDRERRELRLGAAAAAARWKRPWPSSTTQWNARFAMRSPNMRNLPRSAKAHSGKIRPRGTGSPGPALYRLHVRSPVPGPRLSTIVCFLARYLVPLGRAADCPGLTEPTGGEEPEARHGGGVGLPRGAPNVSGIPRRHPWGRSRGRGGERRAWERDREHVVWSSGASEAGAAPHPVSALPQPLCSWGRGGPGVNA